MKIVLPDGIAKKVRTFVAVLFFCGSACAALQEKKIVIISRPGVGFFSNFFGCLHTLAWCLRNNVTPIVRWDKGLPYWQPQGYNGADNVWEYYFEPVSAARATEKDWFYGRYFAPDSSGLKDVCHDFDKHKYAYHSIITKYIRLKPQVRSKIERFVQEHFAGKKVIGIHLRGTDKWKEVKPIDPELICKQANRYTGCTFFVATDEERLLEIAKKLLNGPVIYYDADRSTSDQPVHLAGGNAKRGEDVLIEVLLLSKCDAFIHTCSNVSSAVLAFNPYLEHLYLRGPQCAECSCDDEFDLA